MNKNIKKYSIKNISSNSNRFKEKWKIVQNFVPKKNIIFNNLKNSATLSPIDILKKSFEIKDFQSNNNQNNYNKLNFNILNKNNNFEISKKQEKNDSLSESISYARAIAITLCNFLEQNFYE